MPATLEDRVSKLEDDFSAYKENTTRRLNTYGMRYARSGGANGTDPVEQLQLALEREAAARVKRNPDFDA